MAELATGVSVVLEVYTGGSTRETKAATTARTSGSPSSSFQRRISGVTNWTSETSSGEVVSDTAVISSPPG